MIDKSNANVKIKPKHLILITGFIFTLFIIYTVSQRIKERLEILQNLNSQIISLENILYLNRYNFWNFEYNLMRIEELEAYQTIVNSENIAYVFSEISSAINVNNLTQNRFDISNQRYSENIVMTTLTTSGNGTYENILNFLSFLRNSTYLIITYNVSISQAANDVYFTLVLFIPNSL